MNQKQPGLQSITGNGKSIFQFKINLSNLKSSDRIV